MKNYFLDAAKRKMIRNPDSESPPTIFVGPVDEFDDSKFVPAEVTKGISRYSVSSPIYKYFLLNNFLYFCIYYFLLALGLVLYFSVPCDAVQNMTAYFKIQQ